MVFLQRRGRHCRGRGDRTTPGGLHFVLPAQSRARKSRARRRRACESRSCARRTPPPSRSRRVTRVCLAPRRSSETESFRAGTARDRRNTSSRSGGTSDGTRWTIRVPSRTRTSCARTVGCGSASRRRSRGSRCLGRVLRTIGPRSPAIAGRCSIVRTEEGPW